MSSAPLFLALAFPFLLPPAPVINAANVGQHPPLTNADAYSQITTTDKIVALTLDDGPSRKYTPLALKTAKDEHIPLTFFLIGQEAVRRPDLVLEELAAGHVIGNHTWHHPLKDVGDERGAWEVHQTQLVLMGITGQRPTLFRPPGGQLNTGTAAAARANGLKIITWNVWPGDTNGRLSAAALTKSVLAHVRPGSIILLHDGGANRGNSMAALPMIVKALKAQGYTFLTVPDLLGRDKGGKGKGTAPAPGAGAASEQGSPTPEAPATPVQPPTVPSPAPLPHGVPAPVHPSVTLPRLP
ncbi:polysaccharide deacetylase family protein [Deinococcus sp.]|uniref:polysaccharide deacetylase family protein n=1 Tax=Deinococcus sp. TaxID=47478 RepID=UPI003CC61171